MITANSRFGDYVQAAIAANACQPAIDLALTLDQEQPAIDGVLTMTRVVTFDPEWANWAIFNGPEIDAELRATWMTGIKSQLAINRALKSPDRPLTQAERDDLLQKENPGQLVSELIRDHGNNPVMLYDFLQELEPRLAEQALSALKMTIRETAKHLIDGEREPPGKHLLPGGLVIQHEDGTIEYKNPLEDQE